MIDHISYLVTGNQGEIPGEGETLGKGERNELDPVDLLMIPDHTVPSEYVREKADSEKTDST